MGIEIRAATGERFDDEALLLAPKNPGSLQIRRVGPAASLRVVMRVVMRKSLAADRPAVP